MCAFTCACVLPRVCVHVRVCVASKLWFSPQQAGMSSQEQLSVSRCKATSYLQVPGVGIKQYMLWIHLFLMNNMRACLSVCPRIA